MQPSKRSHILHKPDSSGRVSHYQEWSGGPAGSEGTEHLASLFLVATTGIPRRKASEEASSPGQSQSPDPGHWRTRAARNPEMCTVKGRGGGMAGTPKHGSQAAILSTSTSKLSAPHTAAGHFLLLEEQGLMSMCPSQKVSSH